MATTLGHTKAAPVGWTRAVESRRVRVPLLVVSGLFGLWAVALSYTMFRNALAVPGAIGFDLDIYTGRTASWMAGQGFYLARQLTGAPYAVQDGDALYPPVSMILFAPWVAGVPRILWWAIPLGILVASIWTMRPSLWALPVIAWTLGNNRFLVALICGNPSMWALAFLAAGLVWRWPAAFVPLKLTLAPFALVGARDRRWWVGIGIGLLCCIPFGLLWLDYATVLANARSGADYVLGEWPIALGIVWVWWTSSLRRRRSE